MSTNVYDQALDFVSRRGFPPPPAIIEQAETARLAAMDAERERIAQADARKGRLQRFVDGFIERYPALQDSVQKVGNWSMALIKLFAVNGLASVIMFAALTAEVLRVINGLNAIEASPIVAGLISIVTVASVFFLEFVRFYVEREAGYTEPLNYQWSLRLIIRNWRYKLGLGGDAWEARQTTPAQKLILYQRVIQAGVVITALYGSMAHTVIGHKGTWFEAMIAIITTSSLQEFASWTIGIVNTIAILAISATTSHFVASRARLLEDSTFATGDNKIDLIGFERAANVINGYYAQVRKASMQPPTPAPLTPAITSPALLPRSMGGSIPVKHSVNSPVKRATRAEVAAWFTEEPTRLQLTSRKAKAEMATVGVFTSHVTAGEIRDELVNNSVN